MAVSNAEKDERDLSFKPVVNEHPRRLTAGQIRFYNEQGYLKPFGIYNAREAKANRRYFDNLLRQVSEAHDGRDSYSINGYHVQCAGIWDMVNHPLILDLVEDILGPDFVCWGTHFFCKLPHDPKIVPWHQDASYWPFDKARTVTAWIAIDDADCENACMEVIPGTHRLGHLKWETTQKSAVLNQEIMDAETYGTPVPFELKAGEMSLHADMLAHGSRANTSNRRRCGLTMRYTPVDVRTLTNWNQDSILCRGKDSSGHWANNPRPSGDSVEPKNWQRKPTAIASR